MNTVERQAEIWSYLASIIWKYRNYVKVYTYEQLTDSTEETLYDISDYLNLNMTIIEYENIKKMNIDEIF